MVTNTLKIDSANLTIDEIYNRGFYTVPNFQREYVWESENVERLLQDVFDVFQDELDKAGNAKGKQRQEAHEYFLGSIVVCKNEKGIFQLIDGQQRMTTIYLILCVAYNMLKKSDSNMEKELNWLNKRIMDTHSDKSGELMERLRLTLQYEDSKDILERVVKNEESVDEFSKAKKSGSVRRILDAYRTIREFYKSNLNDDPEKSAKFALIFANNTMLIQIVTPSLANALEVFEAINDRGIGLNATDLLKNLLFMKASSEDHKKLNKLWKELVDRLDACNEKPLRFLRYYIMAHHDIDGGQIREDEVYDWFAKSKHAKKCGIVTNPLAFVMELIECAEAYANFLDSKDILGEENRYLKNIRLLSGALRQQYILILAARHLEKPLFDKLCSKIENLLFCYIIIRETTRSLERYVVQWSKSLRAVGNEAKLDKFIEDHFHDRMCRWSTRFNLSFQELDQNCIRKYRLRYILAKLSQYVDERAWRRPPYTHLDHYMDKMVDVEHILPRYPNFESSNTFDKPDEYYPYTWKLGNLTLLEKTINTSISNSSYTEKSKGYRQSQFLLTKSLVEEPQVGKNTQLNSAVKDLIQFSEWSSQAIDDRQKMLGQLARKVWEMPDPKEGVEQDS